MGKIGYVGGGTGVGADDISKVASGGDCILEVGAFALFVKAGGLFDLVWDGKSGELAGD